MGSLDMLQESWGHFWLILTVASFSSLQLYTQLSSASHSAQFSFTLQLIISSVLFCCSPLTEQVGIALQSNTLMQPGAYWKLSS